MLLLCSIDTFNFLKLINTLEISILEALTSLLTFLLDSNAEILLNSIISPCLSNAASRLQLFSSFISLLNPKFELNFFDLVNYSAILDPSGSSVSVSDILFFVFSFLAHCKQFDLVNFSKLHLLVFPIIATVISVLIEQFF